MSTPSCPQHSPPPIQPTQPTPPTPPPTLLQVSIEEGDAKARELAVMFIETSAKAGFNIKVRWHGPRFFHSYIPSAGSRSYIHTVYYQRVCGKTA